MGTSQAEEKGYSGDALDLWTERARVWARGGIPEGLETEIFRFRFRSAG